MRIMFVQPTADSRNAVLWPPIGLGYLASYVRRDGHEAVIVDMLKDCAFRMSALSERIDRFAPEVLCVSVFTMALPQVREIIAVAKSRLSDIKVIVGGPHLSSLPERAFLDLPMADFAVRGEGEIPLRRLLQSIQCGASKWTDVPGLIYRSETGTAMNRAHFEANVDEYGIPAWDLIGIEAYYRQMQKIPVYFSRGCPFPCTFCAARLTSGRNLRRRSFSHILDELKMLSRVYGVDQIIVEDEGFGASKDFIMGFCRCLLENPLPIEFHMGTGLRLDQVDEELLLAMEKANVNKLIALGIESGSQRILDLMKKGTSLQLIRDKVNLMYRMGYNPTGYFILGYPGETRDEMEQTVRLALELPICQASFSSFVPLPGTEATKTLQDNGELPADFDFSRLIACAVAYAPKGMTTTELQSIRRKAIVRFYLRPRILFPFIHSLFRWRGDIWNSIRRFVRIYFEDNALREKRTD